MSRRARLPGFLYALNRALRAPYLRGVNYHETEARHADNLRRHVEFFLRHYDILDENGLADFIARTPRSEMPALVICFDDGQTNNYEVAAKVLAEFRVRAWFFVIAGFIGTTKDWGAGRIEHFMGWDQLRDLAEQGHVIGSHTWSHPVLARISGAELRREVAGSRIELERHLGRAVRSFCIPFGTIQSFDGHAVAEAIGSYDHVFTANPTFLRPGATPYDLGRIPLHAAMDIDTVTLFASGAIDLRFSFRRIYYARLVHEAIATRRSVGANDR